MSGLDGTDDRSRDSFRDAVDTKNLDPHFGGEMEVAFPEMETTADTTEFFPDIAESGVLRNSANARNSKTRLEGSQLVGIGVVQLGAANELCSRPGKKNGAHLDFASCGNCHTV
jgi:hypothetical protein